MKKYIYILSFIFCAIANVYGQTDNNWIINNGYGLNFSSSTPQLFSAPQNYCTLNNFAFSSSISDCEGNLLFYYGEGNYYNRFNSVMPNGNVCSIGNWNATYLPSFIVPRTDTVYSYFCFFSNYGALYYTIVDMSLDSGRGDLKFAPIKFFDTLQQDFTSNIAITKHSNDTDYWLLYRGVSKFIAFQLGPKGLKSRIEIGANMYSLARIKFSHDGTALVSGNDSTYNKTRPVIAGYLYDFNKTTGVLTNPRVIATSIQLNLVSNYPIQSNIADFEFSPNDSLIYFVIVRYGQTGPNIVQVERFASNILSTTRIISSLTNNYNSYSIQIASDNKIYVSSYFYDTSRFGRIQNPDSVGLACSYTDSILQLRPISVNYLPNLYRQTYRSSLVSNVSSKSACSDSAYFEIRGDTNFVQYVVYFGNGDSAILTNAKRNITYRYTNEGNYKVKLIAYTKQCNYPITRTDSVFIRFGPKAKLLTSVTTLCSKKEIHLSDSSLKSDSVFTRISPLYSKLQPDSIQPFWKTYSGNKDTIFIDSSANYTLIHVAKNNLGCTDTLQQNLNINIQDFPVKKFSIIEKDSAGCLPHTITLHDSGKKSTQTIFHWGDGDSLTTTSPGNVVSSHQRTYTKAGIFKPWQVVSNTDGCKDTFYFPKNITVLEKVKAGFNVVIDSACADVQVTLTDTSKFSDSIKYFSPLIYSGKAGEVATYSQTTDGSYQFIQKAWNKYCKDSVVVLISLYRKQKPDMGLSIDKVAGCPPLEITFNDDSTKLPVKDWSVAFGDGNTTTGNSALQNQKHIYTAAGTYESILTDTALNECTNSDTVIITVHPNPVAQYIVSDTNRCGKLTVTINDNSLLADSITIDWSNKIVGNSSNSANAHQYPFSSVDTVRTIYYTAKTSNGCLDTDTITVAQLRHILPAIPNMLGVSVTNKQEITLEWEKALGIEQYLIERSINGISYSPLSSITPSTDTIQTLKQFNQPTDNLSVYYRIIAADSCAVSSQSSRIAKTVLLKAAVDADEIAILEWTPYEDWQNGVKEYRVEYWDKISAQPNPTYTPLNSLLGSDETYTDTGFVGSLGDERCYRVTAIENGGNNYQSYSNEVCLPLKPVIIIPNAFSPNGDGLNDVFAPSLYAMMEVSMQIFNRYGQLIYSETSQQPHWDGTFEGMPVPSDAYLVMIAAKANNLKKVNYSGIVTIIR